MLESVLNQYGIAEKSLVVENFGNGLINNTWKISENGNAFIVQKINSRVFKKPDDIEQNIDLIASYIKRNDPEYLFVSPLQTVSGKSMLYTNGEDFYRAFPFVPGSYSKDIVETPEQAFEAATQFGRFTKKLKGIDVAKLKITIPSFHDLTLRYNQFLTSLETGDQKRVTDSTKLVRELKERSYITEVYEQIRKNPAFKLRVTHHDTKISNVLFNDHDKGLCVIDLDTVMPGYFISDLGDMFRTYLSPCNEDEKDYGQILVRPAFFEAITAGYLNEMGEELTSEEKEHFVYAGEFMIYMQAIRFLSDYINGDVYYQARYEKHNFVRAQNQIALLKAYQKEKELFTQIVEKYL
ncbi:MAG TPA: aminoglycoside phosphotransferase family protein [Chitinophagaceae bacterium]|nr:aminoglycoside phosphotransferase family protein [Chitinophagaceae bacterium]